MKKVLGIFIIALSFSAHAQNPVPNAGFETWIDYGPYEDPQSWSSLNEATWPFGGVTVKKENASHGGTLAVKLISIGHNNTTIPGVLCTGTVAFSTNACAGGFSVSHTFASFDGFYKYLPVPGDSCVMFAMLSKWNATNGKRDTIAVATFYGDSAADYTFFSVPFNYQLAEVPDSAQIVLYTTKHLLTVVPGSILIVDDVDFSGEVGIDEITSIPVKIFPDPANESLEVQIPPALHAINVDVFDCLGRRMQSCYLNGSQELIPTKQFSEGIFFYKIWDGERRIAASGKFMVKH